MNNRGIGIAEKLTKQEGIAEVVMNSYFDSQSAQHLSFMVLYSICSGIKIGICGLHHPSDPFLFCKFFRNPYSPIENF